MYTCCCFWTGAESGQKAYGETTVLECGGSFTGTVTIHFLEHLQTEFGEKLVVLLDQATYFTAVGPSQSS